MNYPAHQQPTATPARIGQGTAVEQSRAAAEVQAAVVVAQQYPRNIQAAVAEMRESCKQQGLAERAFFRYSRGGSTITGASVHLARELARVWGNVQYGLIELRRDDEYGQSEMQAFAWDVQTNSRNSSTFIVPHLRDKKGGAVKLTELRDIYENNANNGARRVREAIFAILPPWLVEEAKELCNKTLKDGGGKPLAQRVADAIKTFEGIGVTADRIEGRLDRPSGKWTEHDVAQLIVIYKSIQRGEVTVDEEFPQAAVTVDEIKAQQKAAARRVEPSPGLAEHEWDVPTLAATLGMTDADLDERCHRLTGSPLATATPEQISALTQSLAAEVVRLDNAQQ